MCVRVCAYVQAVKESVLSLDTHITGVSEVQVLHLLLLFVVHILLLFFVLLLLLVVVILLRLVAVAFLTFHLLLL